MNDFGPKRPMPEDALCESTDTVKAKRGRPKKKPDYDREKEIEALQQKVIDLFGEPFDDRVERSGAAPSITGFISVLEAYGLSDKNGIYKAIGAIRSENASGLKIGSYWSEFDGTAKKKSEYNYWTLVDKIVRSLSNGKLYKTEQIVRKLLCRVFHYTGIRNPTSGKDYTPATIKKVFEDKYREPYRQWMYEMSTLQKNDRQAVNQVVRKKINELLKINNPETTDIFADLPEHFLDKSAVISYTNLLEKTY